MSRQLSTTVHGIMAATVFTWLAAIATADDKNVCKTPEEAFDTAMAAREKQDVQAFLACLVDESRDSTVGFFIHMTVEARKALSASGDRLSDDQAEALKKTEEFLKENGVTSDLLNQFAKDLKDKPPEDRREFVRRLAMLAQPVKNRAEFAAKLLKLAAPLKTQPWTNGFNGKLEDVEVKDDTATAKVLQKLDGGKERKVPLGFKKVDGTWKIDILGGADSDR
jgi:hypothetical protein